MSELKNADMPAMPLDRETGYDIDRALSSLGKYGMPTGIGLTKRERACIDLKIPESGDAELDALIDKSRHQGFMAMAMQALITADRIDASEKRLTEDNAAMAVDAADELLERLS